MAKVRRGDLVVGYQSKLTHVVEEASRGYVWVYCMENPVVPDTCRRQPPSTAFPDCIRCVGLSCRR